MPTKDFYGSLSVIATALAFGIYWQSIIRGQTKPHYLTHVIWTLLSGSVALAQLRNGASAGAWSSVTTALGYAINTCLAVKVKDWKTHSSDWFMFGAALISFAFLFLFKSAWPSLIIVTICTFSGSYPTFRKAWKLPHQENASSAFVNAVKFILAILAINNYNFFTLYFPVLFLSFNLTLAALCVVRRLVERTDATKPRIQIF